MAAAAVVAPFPRCGVWHMRRRRRLPAAAVRVVLALLQQALLLLVPALAVWVVLVPAAARCRPLVSPMHHPARGDN